MLACCYYVIGRNHWRKGKKAAAKGRGWLKERRGIWGWDVCMKGRRGGVGGLCDARALLGIVCVCVFLHWVTAPERVVVRCVDAQHC